MNNLGIVVKIQNKNAIIVSEAGLFEMVKYREGMFVGQKVFYNEKDIISKKQKHKYLIPTIASIASIFILLVSYFKFFYSDEIYAYIAVDINPSLELMINVDNIVIDMVAFNEDGKKVLSNIKYKGEVLEKVVYDIIKNSKEQGFIIKCEKKEIVLISTAFDDRKQPAEKELFNNKLINNLKNETDKELDDNIDIKLINVPIEKRYLASKTEISMGKYLIYEKVREKGKDISIDVIKSSTVNQLIEENNINIHELTSELLFTPEVTPTEVPIKTSEPEVTPTKAPIKTSVPEVTPTKAPIKTSVPEVTPTKAPIKTSVPEVTPTKAPIKTSEPGVTPTKAPIKTSVPEVTPTKVPIKTSVPEVTPTKAPIKTSEPGVTPTKAPIKTSEPEVTPTKTPVPVETPTSMPTDAPKGGGSIKVQIYNDNAVTDTDSIYLNIRVVNTGDEGVELSDIKIRYYYTMDDDAEQKFICDWSTVGISNVNGKFIEMSSPVDEADTFLEVSFSDDAGILKPGKLVRLKLRVYKNDWSHYIQSNDYSFNHSANNFVDWERVTGYISGSLVWGKEP